MNRSKRFSFILKRHGIMELIRFLMFRLIGQSDLIRPASTVDIRRSGVNFVENVTDFVNSLTKDKDLVVTTDLMHDALANNELINNRAQTIKGDFPTNWNSENKLRIVLYLLVRLARPSLVIETGTANGSSAAAICAALAANDFGKLVSIDIKDSQAVLVEDKNRKYLDLRKTRGQEKEFYEISLDETSKYPGPKIFLHDSDHSYFGQYSDFAIAKKLNFDFILSDDIDASLAFSKFSKSAGFALFDTRKIIGGVRGNFK